MGRDEFELPLQDMQVAFQCSLRTCDLVPLTRRVPQDIHVFKQQQDFLFDHPSQHMHTSLRSMDKEDPDHEATAMWIAGHFLAVSAHDVLSNRTSETILEH
jgi:hypothetical protein